MTTDDPRELATLSDADLQRLAYARDAGTPDDARMRALAVAELASRAPSSIPLAPSPAAERPAGSSTTATRATTTDTDNTNTNFDADIDADDHPPWWRRPTALLGAGIVVAALVVSGTVQQLSIPRPPAAFAVFDADETVDDRIYASELSARGERLEREPRVLDAVRLPGVGAPYRLVASVAGARDSEPFEQEVCLTVFLETSPLSSTCADYPDFLSTGVAGGADLFGLDLAYSWDAEGASRLDVMPTGPSSLTEIFAIRLESIALLQAAPPGIPESVATSARRPATVAPLLGPSVIGEVPGWILLAEVGRLGLPGSELAVCVWATQREFPSPVVATQCRLASEFARFGLSTEARDDLPVAFAWSPSGEITFEVEGFIPG